MSGDEQWSQGLRRYRETEREREHRLIINKFEGSLLGVAWSCLVTLQPDGATVYALGKAKTS